ncbi:MAG TPA: protein kinase [Isosphaeraceae bacterium]|jgi:WD40 repeat protein/serine/threonine protein kinase|nr:protein kinase [Isosphaeraceae bacterium]
MASSRWASPSRSGFERQGRGAEGPGGPDSAQGTDRDLLLALTALSNELVSGPELASALRSWAREGSRPLGQILRDQGALAGTRAELVEALVRERWGPARAANGVGPLPGPHRVPDGETIVAGIGPGPADEGDDDPEATRAGAIADFLLGPGAASRFRRLRLHARGGLGTVSVAHDAELGREVALKELQDRFADDPSNRARFVREAEITGGLEHPGVVPVYALGRSPDGRPYYAMRFIRGDSLKEAIARYHAAAAGEADDPGALGLRQLLGRFVDVCNTMAYAHSRGVVHRDLKPANIVLGPFGETLVVDWGLAKASGRPDPAAVEAFGRPSPAPAAPPPLIPATGSVSADTLPGSSIGTPGFMSPEQAAGDHARLGPASDVYSLGATLYCLLTGRPPFEGPDIPALLRRVERGDFPPPRKVCRAVPSTLEAICLKAMAARPEGRYDSARALATDIERWLADEPVSARHDPPAERLARWARRHRTWARAATAALAIVAVVAVAAATVVDRARGDEREQHRRAEARRREAERLSADLAIDRGLALCERGKAGRGTLWLARSLEIAPAGGGDDLRAAARAELAAWRRSSASLVGLFPHAGPVQGVAVRPDGRALLTAGGPGRGPGEARLWELPDDDDGLTLPHGAPVDAVAFGPDGRLAATAGADGRVRLWDGTSGRPVGPAIEHGAPIAAVAFHPDGRTVLTAGLDGVARRFDLTTGRAVGPACSGPAPLFALAVSPDGRTLATAGAEWAVRLWDLDTGRPSVEPLPQCEEVYALAFGPDGRAVLVAGRDAAAQLWDVAAGKPIGAPLRHAGPIFCVAFGPDGRTLATGGDDNLARLWDAATGKPIGPALEHLGSVTAVAFSPDGRTLVTGARDGLARAWRPPARAGRVLTTHEKRLECLALGPDGRTLAVGDDDGRILLLDAETGRPLGPAIAAHRDRVSGLAFRPDGRALLTAGRDGVARAWALADGAPMGPALEHGAPALAVAYRPDGRAAITGDGGGRARLWDLDTGKPLGPSLTHGAPINAVAIRPDGRAAITGDGEGTARLWDLANGKPLGPPLRHAGPIYRVAFSPDGRLVATGGDDNLARLWDAATGKPIGLPLEHLGSVVALSFSPDGRLVATGARDRSARLWDIATGKPIGPDLAHEGSVFGLAFRPDGRTLLTAGADRAVRSWPLAAAEPGDLARERLRAEVAAGLTLDPDGVVHVLNAASWRARRRGLGDP